MNRYGPLELHDDGEPTGKYHYTRKHGSGNTARVWPLGYCGGKPVTTKEEYEEWMGKNAPEDWDEDSIRVEDALRTLKVHNKIVAEYGNKFHNDGHDTKEEARKCYTEYCLDIKTAIYSDEDTEVLRYHGASTHGLKEPVEDDDIPANIQGRECGFPNDDVDCDTYVAYPSATIAGPGMSSEYYLCSEHCTHEFIGGFWKAPMEVIGSF